MHNAYDFENEHLIFVFCRWLVIFILLIYMGAVLVILLNVLIAQLSDTYSEAKKFAKLQYAADTMRIISRLECNRIPYLVSKVFEGRCYAYTVYESWYRNLLSLFYWTKSARSA